MALAKELLRAQLDFVLEESNFESLGEKYSGKVRDCYISGDKRYLVASDRLSCFDRCVTSVPFKGEILTALAAYWFKKAEHIAPSHVLDLPDPQVTVGQNCEVFPFEVVIREYLAGSAWRAYARGESVSGVELPPGLKEFEKLPQPIVTPSTKAAIGEHDEPISREEIIASGKVSATVWDDITQRALALFEQARDAVASRGLILADTKYEFGLFRDQVLLVDEIQTLDCSRYWIAESYQERVLAGKAPEMLDKEPTRRWLASQGYTGEGEIPEFSAEHRIEIAEHYINSFELITGEVFEAEVGDPVKRIRANLGLQ
jgi:phosphoribosylaminoimidazole-succinocarboxamide synthase